MSGSNRECSGLCRILGWEPDYSHTRNFRVRDRSGFSDVIRRDYGSWYQWENAVTREFDYHFRRCTTYDPIPYPDCVRAISTRYCPPNWQLICVEARYLTGSRQDVFTLEPIQGPLNANIHTAQSVILTLRNGE